MNARVGTLPAPGPSFGHRGRLSRPKFREADDGGLAGRHHRARTAKGCDD